MFDSKTASIVLLIIGIGLLAVSVSADVIGIGGQPGFGDRQMLGTFTGAVIILVAGLFLTLPKSR